MKTFDDIGIQVPHILLPNREIDLTKWSVIACDQFTSQPEYWRQVERVVGSAPSTLNMILPEVYLEQAGDAGRIDGIQGTMHKYLHDGILQPHDGMIYVERMVGNKARKGIVLCLDLEQYDYNKGSSSLIRATEGTIVERLPPRMKIREGAPLELPHILVLIDDPQCTVIEPVGAGRDKLKQLYDFDLMLESGHLSGYAVDSAMESQVVAGLRALASPENFAAKYGVDRERPVLLFAMGDGNHSLATAKAVWEKMKSKVGQNHPARYAMVEIENVHDDGLDFKPIHRVLFGVKKDVLSGLRQTFGAGLRYIPVESGEEMVWHVDSSTNAPQVIGMVGGELGKDYGLIEIYNPTSNLPVGTVQTFLDAFLKDGLAEKIDYVHGKEITVQLGIQPGNVGLYFPCMNKSDLFKTVVLDGALPRKTFSMGEAREKRFYMECRKIAEK